MVKAQAISVGGIQVIGDRFNRVTSASAPGNSWTASAGTWGVTGERLYSVTDADADFITWDALLRDGYLQYTLTGTTNHDTVYRTPSLAFRIRKDYLEAIDTTTCLLVRLLGTSTLAYVDLRKNDGGTEESLATAAQTTVNGTYYVTGVEFEGTLVRVWVNGVQLLQHQLVGSDVKYLDYDSVGVRLDKAGSPATAARVDDFFAYSVHNRRSVSNWGQSGDRLTLSLSSPSSNYLYTIEGSAPLSALAADTTQGTIASDSTAALEIQTTDPAYQLLIDMARLCLFEHAAQPGNTADLETRSSYAAAAQAAQAAVDQDMRRLNLATTQPRRGFRHP